MITLLHSSSRYIAAPLMPIEGTPAEIVRRREFRRKLRIGRPFIRASTLFTPNFHSYRFRIMVMLPSMDSSDGFAILEIFHGSTDNYDEYVEFGRLVVGHDPPDIRYDPSTLRQDILDRLDARRRDLQFTITDLYDLADVHGDALPELHGILRDALAYEQNQTITEEG